MVSSNLDTKNGEASTPMHITKMKKKRESNTSNLDMDHGFTSKILQDMLKINK